MKEKVLEYLNEGIEGSGKKLEREDICVLHSDRELELKEKLYIEAQGSMENVLLPHEYINLFAHIIPKEAKGLIQIDHILSFFRKTLGLAESPEEVERVFTLHLKEGKMINPIDKERNVSLRVETFVGMFSDICIDIVKKTVSRGVTEDEAKKEVEISLSHAGLICGQNFGKEIVTDVWRGGAGLTIQEKFNKWCAFDSDVGFGRFSNEIEIDSEGLVTNGKIILKSNFLASGRTSTDSNLCSFMTGYIQGVLRELTGTEVKVTHEPKDCIQYQKEKKKCDFYFRRV
ncbi:MAG: hypothetical protein QME81_06430 [bacterium]|nr:hypothetical protein [bacterium]